MTATDLQSFLKRVWPERLLNKESLELRLIDRKANTIRREFSASTSDVLKNVNRFQNGKYDIYFGVSTRVGNGGKKRDCLRTRVLWVDLDGKKLDYHFTHPKPNMIVDSGGGLHAYWILHSSVLLQTEERWKEVEAINRGLAEKFGGDIQCADSARILRIPGTHNLKYQPKREVKAYFLHDTFYYLQDFKRLGIYSEKENSAEEVNLGGGKVIKNLSPRIKQLLKAGGNSHNGDFSRQDSAAITSLLSAGYSPEDTYATFLDSPRGKHAAERKSGHLDDYLQRTISRAVAFLNKAASNGSNGHISVNFGKESDAGELEDGIVSKKASEVQIETPRWVWPGYLPAGKITILAGDPGLGKSTIALDLAARISKGTFLPEAGRTVRGTCLIASAEDAAEDTIVPRLIAGDADLGRIEIMRHIVIDGEKQFLSFPRDLEELRTKIIKTGARLTVVDPLNAFLARDVDSHKDQDIRSVLAPFEDIAEATGTALLIVAHLNKKEDTSILYRVGGSIGFVGAARSVMAVSPVPDRETRVLYSIKSTLSRTPPSLEYKTRDVKRTRKQNEWLGEETLQSSMIRWMGQIEFDPRQGVVQGINDVEGTIRDFLYQVIGDAEVCTDEIFREAKQAGIPRGQLIRMRESIGILNVKKKDGWYWKWAEK